jgi:hypothetical protein
MTNLINVDLARQLIRDRLVIPTSKPGPHPLALKKERFFTTADYRSAPEEAWVRQLNEYIDTFNHSDCYDGRVYCTASHRFCNDELTKIFPQLMMDEKCLKRSDSFIEENVHPDHLVIYWTWQILLVNTDDN